MNVSGVYNVLFLGNGNSARSIMAETILNREGRGKFCAWSAGILADAEIDAQAADLMRKMGFDISGARPKLWSDLAGDGAPEFDFVFTVCDEAAMLPRSMWPGQPVFAHWGIADPAKSTGNEAQVRLAYADAFRMLSNRIVVFTSLPLRALDTLAMQRKLDVIGSGEQTAVVAA